MAISLVGTTTSTSTTITIPTHQAGDLILIWAVRGGSTTQPTLPAGYTSIQAPTRGTVPTCAGRLGYKIATGTGDTSGTWTNATAMTCHVYRPSAGSAISIGQSANNTSTTATVNYPGLTMADTSGNSWVAAFAGCSNTAQTLNTPPTGMTSESNVTAASSQAVGFDTNGAVSSWSNQNVNVGSSGQSVTAEVEIMLTPLSAFTSNVYQHVAGGGNPFSRGNSGNAYKIPLINSSGSGNCLVLAITYDGGATVSSVADNINGTWGAATVTASGGAGNLDSKIFVFPNIASGQTTITVTFGSSTTVFQYCVTELYGIATSSPGAGSTSAALSTTTAAGSFTPTNNNGTGGNFIWAYFAKADQVPTRTTTTIRAAGSFTLLNADIAWNNANDSMTKAVEAFVQTTSAAINPAIVSVAETGDHWNSLAVALKISSGAGTPPPSSGIIINRIHHFATLHFPSTGNYNIQVPSIGNLRVIMSTDPNIRSTTFVTDSEGNTWTSAGTGSGVWYLANAQPNSNLIIYTTGGGTDITLSWRYVDISGADTSPFDNFTASGQTVNNLASFTASPSPAPTNSNGLVIANIELGQGPGLAVTAPSGAVWDLCTYTGETDLDLIENADIMAHYSNTASGAETWTFTITQIASNSTAGSFVTFKAAATGTAIQLDFLIPDEWFSVVRGDSVLPLSELGNWRKDVLIPNAWTESERLDFVAPTEWRFVSRQDDVVPDAWMGNLREDALAPDAWNGNIREDGLIPDSQTSSVREDALIPDTWLQNLALDFSIPIAWGRSWQLDNLTPDSWLQGLRLDFKVPTEWLGTATPVQQDANSPIGWLGNVRGDTVAPIEWIGINLRIDALSPIEWLTNERRDVLIPTERRGALQQDSNVILAWSGLFRQDSNVPNAWAISSRGDTLIPSERRASTAASARLPDAWISTSSSDRSVPIAWSNTLVTVRQDLIIPLAWGALLQMDVITSVSALHESIRDTHVPINWSNGIRIEYLIPFEWNRTFIRIVTKGVQLGFFDRGVALPRSPGLPPE